MNEPGDWLVTHRAPEALLRRAMARERPAPSRAPLALAAAALLAAGGGMGWYAHELAAPGGPPMVVAGAEDALVPVRLVLHAPDALTVSVAGTFNGWDPQATPLVRGAEGTFYIVLPLKPGRYEYMFVLDGERWTPDPAATLTQPDAFGARNGILDV